MNKRFKEALIESRRIRCVDRIRTLGEEFSLINFEFLVSIKNSSRKRPINKLSVLRHEKAVKLVKLFRFRQGKDDDFDRVIELILEIY